MSGPRSSVVYWSGEGNGGNVELATSLLGNKIHAVAGGGAGLYGLGDQGVYDLESGDKISDVELRTASVGNEAATGVASNKNKSSLYSWGLGELGELGLGPGKSGISEPRRVNYNVKFTSVSAGSNHSAALDAKGNAYAWGQNFSKQLGLYTKTIEGMRELRPISETEDMLFTPRFLPFSLHKPVAKIACGNGFTVAVTKDGCVWSWGAGESGQLGTGRCTHRELPAQVVVTPISADKLLAGSEKSLKDKKKQRRSIDKGIPKKEKEVFAVDLACGTGHVIVVSDEGKLYGWGLNKFGQLGVGDTDTRGTAVEIPVTGFPVPGAEKNTITSSHVVMKKVYGYSNSTACIDDQGKLWTWGSSTNYRLMREVSAPNCGDSIADGGSLGGDRSMSLQSMASTMRLAALNGTVGGGAASRKKLLPGTGKITYSAEPGMVYAFDDQIIESFAYSKNASAAVIISAVNNCAPSSGPMKGFSRVLIDGSGFWDSPTIIVKFQLRGSDMPPRSCAGKLVAPRQISCKPPKFSEPGVYDVTVAMDGTTFLPQELVVRSYKETSITKISPKLVDLRKPETNTISITAKALCLYDEEDINEEGEKMWPTEKDLEDKICVKLVVSCSAPGAPGPVTTEHVYSGKLVPLPSMAYDTTIAADGSITSNNNSVVESKGGSVAGGGSVSIKNDDETSLGHGSQIGSLEGGSSILSHEKIVFPDRVITCEADFSSMGPPGSLIMIRGSLSLNGQDFGTPSPVETPIICHSFEPTGSTPACAPVDDIYDAENNVCSREIQVIGNSFIPTEKLPPGMSIEAVIRAEVPGKKGKKPTKLEKICPVSCEHADMLSIEMPTLEELLLPGTQIPPKTPNTLEEVTATSEAGSRPTTAKSTKSTATSAESVEEIMVDLFFRLVAPPPTEAASKQGKKGTPKKKTSAVEEIPLLSPEPIKIYLYKSQPITVTPSLTRRPGGAELVLLGGAGSGFNFSSSDVKVVFYRPDLGMEHIISGEEVHMLGLDESIPVKVEPKPSDEDDEDEEDMPEVTNGVAEDGQKMGEGLEANMSQLSLQEGGSVSFVPAEGEESVSIQNGNSIIGGDLAQGSLSSIESIIRIPSAVNNVGTAHKIAFVCPPLFMPKAIIPPVVETEEGQGEGEEKVEAGEERDVAEGEDGGAEGEGEGEGENGEEQEEAEETKEPEVEYEETIPLDFLMVKVLLDGRSDVPDSDASYISLFHNVEISSESPTVPGGGAHESGEVKVEIDHGCVPSDKVVVRIRGVDGKTVDCTGTLESEAAATPESVETAFAFAASQEAKAAEEAANGGKEGEKKEEDEGEGEGDAEAGEEGEEQKEEEKEDEGLHDQGGGTGSVTFELPDVSELEPELSGKDKLLFVDISLDGGESFTTSSDALLHVK